VGERNAVRNLRRHLQIPADRANVVLAQGFEGLDDRVPVGLFGIDAELRENVVLAFDAGDGLLDVGQDGPVEQELCPGFFDQTAEDRGIERIGNRLPFLLGVGQARQGGKKLLLGVNQLDRDVHLSEGVHDLLRLAFTHQRVVDKDRLELVAQGAVPQDGDQGAVHPAAKRIDGLSVADGLFDLGDLVFDECLTVHCDLLWVPLRDTTVDTNEAAM